MVIRNASLWRLEEAQRLGTRWGDDWLFHACARLTEVLPSY